MTPKGELAPPEFGFSTSSAPTGGPREAPLTWEAMRQVGAGFWLTDHQVILTLLKPGCYCEIAQYILRFNAVLKSCNHSRTQYHRNNRTVTHSAQQMTLSHRHDSCPHYVALQHVCCLLLADCNATYGDSQPMTQSCLNDYKAWHAGYGLLPAFYYYDHYHYFVLVSSPLPLLSLLL